MITPTEQHLRDLFAAVAQAAPPATGLADGARRKARRHRIRTAWVSASVTLATGAAVAAGVLTGFSPAGPNTSGEQPSAQTPTVASLPPGRTAGGPVKDAIAASCVEQYSPGAVDRRPFAFDGTVTRIEPGSIKEEVNVPMSFVTFRINQWFKGGAGDTAVVRMTPAERTGSLSEETVPAYEVGTRLLVSGAPRWGGSPMDEAIAWGCGFTRYYSPQVAAAWADATR